MARGTVGSVCAVMLCSMVAVVHGSNEYFPEGVPVGGFLWAFCLVMVVCCSSVPPDSPRDTLQCVGALLIAQDQSFSLA